MLSVLFGKKPNSIVTSINPSHSVFGVNSITQFKRINSAKKGTVAIKPGITGMWQVSGRSDITDFEEVVRLDKEYIENWDIGLDVKILFKTVMVVVKKDGSM